MKWLEQNHHRSYQKPSISILSDFINNCSYESTAAITLSKGYAIILQIQQIVPVATVNITTDICHI